MESLVAFVLFLSVAAMITWSITSAFASRTAASERATLSGVLTYQLDALTALGTGPLLSGAFTVPSPCADSAPGIQGRSCVSAQGRTVTVAYRFADPDAPEAATCPGPSVDPAAVLAAHGFVQVQACLVSAASAAFADSSVAPGAVVAAQTRTLTPPDAGALTSGRAVTVHLSGPAGLTLPAVYLLLASDPTHVVASAAPTDGQVTLLLGPDVATACTLAAPCVLGAEPGPDFTTTTAGAPRVAVLDVAGVGAPVTVTDQVTGHVYATLEAR